MSHWPSPSSIIKKKRRLREQHVDSAVSIYFNNMLVFVFSGNQSAEKILPCLALMLLRLPWRQTQEEEMAYFFLLTSAIHYLPDGGDEGKTKTRLRARMTCSPLCCTSSLMLQPRESAGARIDTKLTHLHTQRRTWTRPYRHIYDSDMVQGSESFRHTDALREEL